MMANRLAGLLLSISIPAYANAVVLTLGEPTGHVVDDLFVCVTMDWWPSNKANYGVAPWKNAGILEADFSSPLLRAAIDALSPVTLRIGGSQADTITYAMGADAGVPCPAFSPAPSEGDSDKFTGGCLSEARWSEVRNFCSPSAGCRMVFDLSAMHGRAGSDWVPLLPPGSGAWDPSNAASLINVTAESGYPIYGYEYGNELELTVDQFAEGLHQLSELLDAAYPSGSTLMRPKIIATDQINWNGEFFAELLPKVADVLSAVTWHEYPLGPGYNNPDLDAKIMDPSSLDGFFRNAASASELVSSIKTPDGAPALEVWMGETGGAYNSGHNGTSNTYEYGFFYLKSLGGFAANGHTGFCRQTFLGGNYELVDKETHEPNPDMFNALLFKRLMTPGKVLRVSSDTDELQAWAHRGAAGTTSLLVLNFANVSTEVSIANFPTAPARDEYILTPGAEGDVLSRQTRLNGELLQLQGSAYPELKPRRVQANGDPIRFPALSYGFIVLLHGDDE